MKLPYISETMEQFREHVRQVIEQQIVPLRMPGASPDYISRESWQALGSNDLLGLQQPAEYKGKEASIFHSIVLLEELCRAGLAQFTTPVYSHSNLALTYISKFGSRFIKRNYLTKGILGEKIGGLAIHEPSGKVDPAAMNLFARRERNHYLLNGTKSFVLNGEGDMWIVAARTDPAAGASGISLFLVDCDQPGLTIRPHYTLGWQSAALAELVFENARVPMPQLIGQENMGYYYINECYLPERLISAAAAMAMSEYCLESATRYVAQAPRPELVPATVRHELVEFSARLEAIRQLLYYAAWLYEEGLQSVKHCTMAKLLATEFAFEVTNRMLLIYGSNGTLNDYEINRRFRDARMSTLLNGSSEAMREILIKLVVDSMAIAGAKALPGKDPTSAYRDVVANGISPEKSATAPESPNETTDANNEIQQINQPDSWVAPMMNTEDDEELTPEESRFLDALEKAYSRNTDTSDRGTGTDTAKKIVDPLSEPDALAPAEADAGSKVVDTANANHNKPEAKIRMEKSVVKDKQPKTSETAETPPPDVHTVIHSLPERFNPAKADGLKAIMHFKISGPGGGDFTVNISPKKCQVKDGLSGHATCIVETTDRVYLDIETGKTKPQVAFMMGKVKFSNVPQMMRFIEIFNIYPAA